MQKIITLLAAMYVLQNPISAQSATPTWSSQVACIVYSHCTNCHNANGLAPFSLMSYSDASGIAASMKNDVLSGTMPPFHANTQYRHYAHERVLTSEEKNLIAAWADAGAPEGNPADAPVPPVYTSAEEMTTPDLVAQMPVYTVPSTGGDLYRCFVLTGRQAITKFITGIEVVPGNRNVVHHVLVFQDTAQTVVNLDNADAGLGYTSFGGIGSNSAKLIAGWVPGSKAYFLPANMGIKLTANSRIIVQIHYPNGSAGALDSTKVKLQLSTANLRSVSVNPILNHTTSLTNGPLSIPANTVKTFHEQFTVPANMTILNIAPHAHLICRSLKAFGVTTIGDTIPLVDIPNWDFHWQGSYDFQKPIKIPLGTKLHSFGVYDNTANNPENPSNPPQNVSLGEATTDEMMLFYFSYLTYQTGDENMVIDTSSHPAHYLNCTTAVVNTVEATQKNTVIKVFPNPTTAYFTLQLQDVFNEKTAIELTDAFGKIVYKTVLNPLQNNVNIDIAMLSASIYTLSLRNEHGDLLATKREVLIK